MLCTHVNNEEDKDKASSPVVVVVVLVDVIHMCVWMVVIGREIKDFLYTYTLACGFFLEKSHAKPRSDILT